MLRVLRGTKASNLRVFVVPGGPEIPKGETFDPLEYPTVTNAMVDLWKQHRYVEDVNARDNATERAVARQARELARAHSSLALSDTAGVVVDPIGCDDCDFVAKNANGMKIHRGRRHRDKE